jgi:hypothetical protein
MNTREILIQIQESMNGLQTEVSFLKNEVRKLRLRLNESKRGKPKEAILTSPMWCYEWDQMTIDLDSKTWKKIRDGELVTARGRGTRLDDPLPDGDDCFQWDYWTFNEDHNGSVVIKMGEPDVVPESPDIAFGGDLEDLAIFETEVKVTRKKRSRVAT